MRANGAGAATSDQATSDKARGANAGQVRDQSAADGPDSAGQPAREQHAKAVATLQARFATVGWVLARDAAPGTYLASRWGRARPLRRLVDAEAFARQIGAPA